ncbi:MAG: hypothetical protein J3K34DRAFT_473490 [Monoraphidium minutum]|nr:MAG: hypothetical protein J3K34DRAFT_473490 [Monoraphidium minutum]
MDGELHHGEAWLSAAPTKGARAAYACYFLLGAGVLAPWNALLMAADYWAAVFPGRHVDRTFTICYLPACLLLIGAFIRWPRLLGHRARILAGFGGFFALMLAVPMIDLIFVRDDGAPGPPAAYRLVLLTVLLVGVLDGTCQGAIFGDAAALPAAYTHAIVGGTASSGALISALRIATKAALPPTRAGLRASTAAYFGISAACSLACFGVYSAVLPRLGVVAYWRQRRRQDAACAALVWRLAAAVALIYIVTLAIFPGVLAEDTRNVELGDWYPLILMTTFNFADLIGKNLPLAKDPRHPALLAWSAGRALFLPAFLLATHLGAPAAAMGALTLALGVSNGYLTAQVMTSAHDAAGSAAAADMLENVMVFCMVAGLLAGALLGWCWVL